MSDIRRKQEQNYNTINPIIKNYHKNYANEFIVLLPSIRFCFRSFSPNFSSSSRGNDTWSRTCIKTIRDFFSTRCFRLAPTHTKSYRFFFNSTHDAIQSTANPKARLLWAIIKIGLINLWPRLALRGWERKRIELTDCYETERHKNWSSLSISPR